MKGNTLKLVFVLFALLACESMSLCQTSIPKGWQKINADGLFTFYLPQGFRKSDMMGVEHYLGEYFKGETRFLFVHGDTGSNAYDVRRTEEMNDYEEVETKIGGKKANIRTFYLNENGKRRYIAELNIGDWANADVELYMEMSGSSHAVLKMAKQIFRSVEFPKSPRRTTSHCTRPAPTCFSSRLRGFFGVARIVARAGEFQRWAFLVSVKQM